MCLVRVAGQHWHHSCIKATLPDLIVCCLHTAAEVLAEALPGTHVFKAFNTIGTNHMLHPDGSHISGEQLTMMYAGGPEGKDIVEKVCWLCKLNTGLG
jgi:predicted dinucleotide-binding enzyme